MPFYKLARILSTATLLVSCTVQQSSLVYSGNTIAHNPSPAVSPRLKTAIEELRVIKIKLEDGLNPKEYGEDVADLVPIVENAYGDANVLAIVKSAVEGHQLAVQFWQCDRISGYDELFQCRDQVLEQVFTKYPDMGTQAKAAIEGENLSYISAGLDENAVLQTIWEKTAIDTEAALQAVNPTPPQ